MTQSPETYQQDGRLAPAYFSTKYKNVNQFLQTVEKRQYCFESSFQRISTNINSTTDFYNSWHYRLIRPRKQSNKPEVFFESPFENLKLYYEILIVATEPVLLAEEFDYGQKPLQVAISPNSG